MVVVDTLTEDENNNEVYRARVKYLNPFAVDVFHTEGKEEVGKFKTD